MKPRFITPDDPGFPSLHPDLKPPVRSLWVLGEDPEPMGARVAIVGSRRATPYGIEVAHDLAADLALQGVCIVSGLALGIDAAAHEGSLSVGGATIAVLGCGVDVAYPPRHRPLYERIRATGSILSELPLGSPAHARHFPERNRIIAAMSLGVVIVQADSRGSGAMITAGIAHGLDIDVFAVPGDVRSDLSTGPHSLLREPGAHVCASAGDVLAVIEGEKERRDAAREDPFPDGLPPQEEAVLRIVWDGPARPDQIAARAGLDPIAVARILTRLELARRLTRAPAGEYQRRR